MNRKGTGKSRKKKAAKKAPKKAPKRPASSTRPKRSSSPRRAWFRPYDANGRTSTKLPNGEASGVYAIRDRKSKRVLYVGESHTGRLRGTLLRHLQSWNQQNPHYNPEAVEVCWRQAPAGSVFGLQDRWQAELAPRDSVLGGGKPEDFNFGHNAAF